MDPALLILDLDETLIYGVEQPLARDADLRVGPFRVYLRPHVREFIAGVAKCYRLAVWTSAGESYAGAVVRELFPAPFALQFVWSCERCVRRLDAETREYYYVKDLRKVKRRGFSLERVLVVDDSPEKLERHYGNHVRVRRFEGDEADVELRNLLPYLEGLRDAENFRRIEKRHWRGR